MFHCMNYHNEDKKFRLVSSIFLAMLVMLSSVLKSFLWSTPFVKESQMPPEQAAGLIYVHSSKLS